MNPPLLHHLNEIERLRSALAASRRRERVLAVQCQGLREVVKSLQDRPPVRPSLRWRLLAACVVLALVVASFSIWGILVN